jgi:hypothetical protein
MLDRTFALIAIFLLLGIFACFGVTLANAIVVLRRRFECKKWIAMHLDFIELSFTHRDNLYFNVTARFTYTIEGKTFESRCAFLGAELDGVISAEKQFLESKTISRDCLICPSDISKAVLAYNISASLRARIISCVFGMVVLIALILGIIFNPFPPSGASPFVPL